MKNDSSKPKNYMKKSPLIFSIHRILDKFYFSTFTDKEVTDEEVLSICESIQRSPLLELGSDLKSVRDCIYSLSGPIVLRLAYVFLASDRKKLGVRAKHWLNEIADLEEKIEVQSHTYKHCFSQKLYYSYLSTYLQYLQANSGKLTSKLKKKFGGNIGDEALYFSFISRALIKMANRLSNK